MPTLASTMKIEEESLPGIFLYNPVFGLTTRYDGDIEDMWNISPDILMAWAEMTNAKTEIDFMENKLAENETNEEKLNEEQVKMLENRLPQMRLHYSELKEEHKKLVSQDKSHNIFAAFLRDFVLGGGKEKIAETAASAPSSKSDGEL